MWIRDIHWSISPFVAASDLQHLLSFSAPAVWPDGWRVGCKSSTHAPSTNGMSSRAKRDRTSQSPQEQRAHLKAPLKRLSWTLCEKVRSWAGGVDKLAGSLGPCRCSTLSEARRGRSPHMSIIGVCLFETSSVAKWLLPKCLTYIQRHIQRLPSPPTSFHIEQEQKTTSSQR